MADAVRIRTTPALMAQKVKKQKINRSNRRNFAEFEGRTFEDLSKAEKEELQRLIAIKLGLVSETETSSATASAAASRRPSR